MTGATKRVLKMSNLQLPIRLYIATVAIAALGLTLLALVHVGPSDTIHVALAPVVAGLATVAFLLKFPLGPKLKLELGTSATMLAILVFQPGIAMLVIGVGVLLGYIIRRREWDEALFNVSQTVLSAGAGSLILGAAGWDFGGVLANGPEQLLAVPVAAAARYLVNALLVATVIGLQLGRSPFLIWRHALGSDVPEEIYLLAVGFVAAIVIDIEIWAVLLCLLPAFAIYRALEVRREGQGRSRAVSDQPAGGRLLPFALHERREQLYWLIGTTAVIISLVVVTIIHLPGDVDLNPLAVYTLTVLATAVAGVLVVAPRWLTDRSYLFWLIAGILFPFFEALTVYFTGGAESPFFVLFYFSLFFLGMVGGHRGALCSSMLVGLMYMAAVLWRGDLELRSLLMRLAITLLSFYGIAFFAAFLGNLASQQAHEASQRGMRIVGLNIVNSELSATLERDVLLEKIPQQLCSQLGFRRAFLYTMEGEKLCLASGHTDGEPDRLVDLMDHLRRHPLTLDSHTVEAEVARRRHSVMSTDVGEEFLVSSHTFDVVRTQGFAAAPLLTQGRLLGVILTDHYPQDYAVTEEELILLDSFAGLAALVLLNSELMVQAGQAEAFRQLDALKTEFLGTISHELRTPLTLIRAGTDLLIEDVSDGLSPVQKQMIETIGRNSGRLSAYMEEILEMAQLEDGRIGLNLQITDLRLLVDEVAQSLHLLVEDKEHTLHLDLPPGPCLVEVDRHRLSQVITNLVTNACKYTPRGGKIWVCVQPRRETVFLEVRDNGPGIPPDKLERIFEKFYRLPDSEHSAKGTGLGLAIARSLVELHGGTIEVSRRPGEGAEFVVSLRCVSRCRSTPQPSPQDTGSH